MWRFIVFFENIDLSLEEGLVTGGHAEAYGKVILMNSLQSLQDSVGRGPFQILKLVGDFSFLFSKYVAWEFLLLKRCILFPHQEINKPWILNAASWKGNGLLSDWGWSPLWFMEDSYDFKNKLFARRTHLEFMNSSIFSGEGNSIWPYSLSCLCYRCKNKAAFQCREGLMTQSV